MKTIKLILLLMVMARMSAFAQSNLHVIETELGDIVVQVFPEKAPITVKNFERYEQLANFSGATFYRVVRLDNQPKDSIKIEVIQGNFTANENSLENIAHESTNITGIRHEDGVISMARNQPGTASVAFFICVNNQPALDFGGMRNRDGQGFAAFGKVVSGMDIVRKIQQGETDHQTLKEPIKIIRIYKKS